MVVAARRARRTTAARRRSFAPARHSVRRRAFDIIAAAALLLLLWPLLVVISLAVFAGSGVPILFGQLRIGHGGRPFRMWKFRTMRVDAERVLRSDPELRRKYLRSGFKLPTDYDPRVTPIGRWLRRTYLDEMPQLFNVLNGTMSLFGPRPILTAEELENYGSDSSELTSVPPGLFGAWTCLGRGRPGYPERARIELDYARNRDLRTDLRILIRAVPAVLRGQAD